MSDVKPSVRALAASDDTLSFYVGALDERSPATVRRAIAAIRLMHERSGFPMLFEERPATVAALAEHRHRHARAAPRRKTPATDHRLQRTVAALDTESRLDVRSRASSPPASSPRRDAVTSW